MKADIRITSDYSLKSLKAAVVGFEKNDDMTIICPGAFLLADYRGLGWIMTMAGIRHSMEMRKAATI